MLINKKITLLNYYNDTPTLLSEIANNLVFVYNITNGRFYKWSKFNYQVGLVQNFEYLEKNKGYIVISESGSSYEIDSGSNNEEFEFIVDKIQICTYKGQDLSIGAFKDNLSSVYKISNTGISYLKWDKINFENGLIQAFDAFSDSSTYILISSNISYVLWPPNNFNKSQLLNNNNINWGLLEHIK